jgi:1,4-alpha-glucan branching enzyme
LYLSQGTHSYKFLVDGKEIIDEKNKAQMPDGKGGLKSVVQLGKPYLFTLPGFTNAKEVQLIGSFNKWQQQELFMKKTAAGWQLPYVLGPGNYEYKFLVDGVAVTDPARPPSMKDAGSFLVIERNYTFRLKGFSNSKTVYLAGDFNNWNPTAMPMKKEGNEWLADVHLSIGKHLYKFIVDGEWIKDPDNKLWERNEFKTGNSIIWIDK